MVSSPSSFVPEIHSMWNLRLREWRRLSFESREDRAKILVVELKHMYTTDMEVIPVDEMNGWLLPLWTLWELIGSSRMRNDLFPSSIYFKLNHLVVHTSFVRMYSVLPPPPALPDPEVVMDPDNNVERDDNTEEE